MLKHRIAFLAGLLAVAVFLSGCGISLVGKRRRHIADNEYSWQVGLLTARPLHPARSLVAIYDDELPTESGFTVLQLWGGSTTKEK